MNKTNIKFDFDDINIKPNTFTEIESRSEVNPYVKINGFKSTLPLFTAPMSSVIDETNFHDYDESLINVVLPRTVKRIDMALVDTLTPMFYSYGIGEFEKVFVNEEINHSLPSYVLIDVANGHMEKIMRLACKAKEKYPNLTLMAGNIANPETYRWYASIGAIDYVRVGIGNGNGCLTTQQTGVGFPKASLIRECYLIKEELMANGMKNPTKIVADGGMKDYADVIKALALGADYVMVGSLFNKALESSGQNYLYNIKISPMFAETCFNLNLPVKKQFYGMSTKLAQKKMGNTKLKTSEGVVRYRKVEYTIENWIENFESYLRSAMSYSNARTLDDFIGNAEFELITENAFNRFKK